MTALLGSIRLRTNSGCSPFGPLGLHRRSRIETGLPARAEFFLLPPPAPDPHRLAKFTGNATSDLNINDPEEFHVPYRRLLENLEGSPPTRRSSQATRNVRGDGCANLGMNF